MEVVSVWPMSARPQNGKRRPRPRKPDSQGFVAKRGLPPAGVVEPFNAGDHVKPEASPTSKLATRPRRSFFPRESVPL